MPRPPPFPPTKRRGSGSGEERASNDDVFFLNFASFYRFFFLVWTVTRWKTRLPFFPGVTNETAGRRWNDGAVSARRWRDSPSARRIQLVAREATKTESSLHWRRCCCCCQTQNKRRRSKKKKKERDSIVQRLAQHNKEALVTRTHWKLGPGRSQNIIC